MNQNQCRARLQFPFSDEPSSRRARNANGIFMRMHARTHARIYLSSPCARVPSFIPSVARVVRRSARNAVASWSRSTFDSGRFKRGSDENRTSLVFRGGSQTEVSVGFLPAGVVSGGCARACVFCSVGGWAFGLGVCVFSLRGFNANKRRAREGWMDGWMVRTERVDT